MNVTFAYTRAREVTPVQGVVHIIPDPATMILLATTGFLMLPRRGRSARISQRRCWQFDRG